MSRFAALRDSSSLRGSSSGELAGQGNYLFFNNEFVVKLFVE
jgi:hypothetical protein